MQRNRHRIVGAFGWVTIMLVAASSLAACGGDDGSTSGAELPSSSDRPTATAAPAGGDVAQDPVVEEPVVEEPVVEEPVVEEPVVEEPVVEEPVVEEPAATAAPTDLATVESEDDGLTSEEWFVVILIAVFVLLVVIAIAAMTSRRSRRRDEEHTSDQHRLDDVTRRSRLIHDSAVPSVLQATDSTALQTTWATVRSQLIDVETEIESFTRSVPDDGARTALHELGLAVAGVRGALEANVGLRSDAANADRADLLDSSTQTVLMRNEQLESALQHVLYLHV